MKTLRDTINNNNSATTPVHSSASTRPGSVVSNGTWYSNSTMNDPDSGFYPSPNGHRFPRTNLDSTGVTVNSTKFVSQNNNNNQNFMQLPTIQGLHHPYASMFNGDVNQWTTAIQTYLANAQKFNPNMMPPTDSINPMLYFQLVNANTVFMQHLAAMQNNLFPGASVDVNRSVPTSSSCLSQGDSTSDTISAGRSTHVLQADSNVFVPKTRPMTQEEIAEHARLVYQRALQRNQLQQQSDLMKHFYETLNSKQQSVPTSRIYSTPQFHKTSSNSNEVPTVPNVSHITSAADLDVLDTMITSSVETAVSSLSLLSVDDSKMVSKTSSILDPSAPIFIPRQSRAQLADDDGDLETTSSSSDSDFNDFHYLDQFLDEFYPSDRQNDNHLVLHPEKSNHQEEKESVHSHALGQGDSVSDEKQTPSASSSPTVDEQQSSHYSIYQLLNRYRNPRCHLVLPEWSRLSLILPNVCSMRAHTYKIKRYFAYRRRLCEEEEHFPNISSTESKELSPTTINHVSVRS